MHFSNNDRVRIALGGGLGTAAGLPLALFFGPWWLALLGAAAGLIVAAVVTEPKEALNACKAMWQSTKSATRYACTRSGRHQMMAKVDWRQIVAKNIECLCLMAVCVIILAAAGTLILATVMGTVLFALATPMPGSIMDMPLSIVGIVSVILTPLVLSVVGGVYINDTCKEKTNEWTVLGPTVISWMFPISRVLVKFHAAVTYRYANFGECLLRDLETHKYFKDSSGRYFEFERFKTLLLSMATHFVTVPYLCTAGIVAIAAVVIDIPLTIILAIATRRSVCAVAGAVVGEVVGYVVLQDAAFSALTVLAYAASIVLGALTGLAVYALRTWLESLEVRTARELQIWKAKL